MPFDATTAFELSEPDKSCVIARCFTGGNVFPRNMDHTPLLVAGETLVDLYPAQDDVTGPSFERYQGGAPANIAVGLANLGHEPLCWTRVGRGPLGNFLADSLERAGVQTELIERDPSALSSIAIVDPERDRFLFYRAGGAETQLRPSRIPAKACMEATWLVLSGISLAMEPAATAIESLLAVAETTDTAVFLDPNYRPAVWNRRSFMETIGRRLTTVDVISATTEELARLEPNGETVRERVDGLHDRGPHTVCLTRGRDGAFLSATSEAPWGPAAVSTEGLPVESEDPIGAGDAFDAGVLHAIRTGASAADTILETGTAMGALATRQRGATTALPDRTTLENFLTETEASDQ